MVACTREYSILYAQYRKLIDDWIVDNDSWLPQIWNLHYDSSLIGIEELCTRMYIFI
jgi:hypothetical protein